MKTIQSWINQRVRIKKEYIKTELIIDDEASTYDEDGNIVEEVFYERTYIDDGHIGMTSCFYGRFDEVFNVRYDCYGVDLFEVRDRIEVDKLPEPTHQIIVGKENDYPYMWDSKYFEVITYKTTIEETTVNEFNNNIL